MQFNWKKFDFSLGEERSQLLICIGIALVIWVFMKLSDEFSTVRHVELKYLLPSMMEFSEKPPADLQATVTATGLTLISNFLRHPQPSITIDLREKSDRGIEREEMIAKVESKLGIDVKNIDRSYLFLSLDSMATKKVPIILNAEVDYFTDFFSREGIRLSEDSAFISGTPEQLAKVSEVNTEKMVCTSVKNDLRRQVKLVRPFDGKVQVVPEAIEVLVTAEQYTEKSFNIPVGIPNLQDSIRLIPSEVAVKCIVGLNHYRQLKDSDITLMANIRSDTELANQNSVPVIVTESPDWVRSIEITPPYVEYYIIQ